MKTIFTIIIALSFILPACVTAPDPCAEECNEYRAHIRNLDSLRAIGQMPDTVYNEVIDAIENKYRDCSCGRD